MEKVGSKFMNTSRMVLPLSYVDPWAEIKGMLQHCLSLTGIQVLGLNRFGPGIISVGFNLASFPGLPTIQFLIAYSIQ